MSLTTYRTLGRSGLKVSPLALGTMTFGTDWGWGADESTSKALFDRYLDAGGNFFDTADLYVSGRSEEMLGRFVADRAARDRVVIATKFSYNADPGNPNAGGNGRKNIRRAVEGSLRRLGTDYIDLLWLHTWDIHTPVEEVVRSLDALVRAGTVRYIGLSDVPAWYLTRYNTIAELQGFERAIALQPEYSLVERTIEREHLPAARELGVGVTPWSPLASGFLTGKYVRGAAHTGRLETVKSWGNPAFDKLTDRNWAILDTVRDVAREQERSLAQVALAWVVQRPGVTSTLIGATKLAQLDDNLGALDVVFTPSQLERLNAASALEAAHPYVFFDSYLQNAVNGNVTVLGF
jgi:aryl-alcohol dehydrogenase-like predicted oxidoreductase